MTSIQIAIFTENMKEQKKDKDDMIAIELSGKVKEGMSAMAICMEELADKKLDH